MGRSHGPAALAAVLAVAAAAACTPAASIRPTARPVKMSPCGRAFVLVDHGRPAATIVIPPDAGEAAQRAADILRTSVMKMSGVDLPVLAAAEPGRPNCAVLGFPPEALPPAVATALPTLRPDGFVAATATGNLYIVGGSGRGIVFGVVHLLEKYFGCRRFGPAAERFPRSDDLALGCLYEAVNPANDVRAVNGDLTLDADYRDWLRLTDLREIYGDGFYVHTFDRLVPWRTWFASHPEYFALMNGKRVPDQPCLSRPEVFDIAVAALRAEMAAQPGKRTWSVSQNDNFFYCQCPECLKTIEEEGSPAGPVIRFVNRVAALFPDKTISTLAYQYSRPAPHLTRPLPNVEIMLCTIELDRSRPIAADPAGASFVGDIGDWARLTDNIYLWDYTVNFSHFVSPFPNLRVLAPNIRFFASHGVGKHFQQTNTGPGHEWSELKAYLLARLLWDPGTDPDRVVDEFLDGYYGKAGRWLRRYIDALHDALERSGARLDIYEPPAVHAADHLSAADIALYNRLFDRAEAAAAGDREARGRVRTARLPLLYAELEIAKDDLFGPRGFYEERSGRFAARPDMVRRLDAFAARSREAGVRNLKEGGLAPEAYVEAFRRFVDVPIEGNRAFRRPVSADPPPAAKYARGDMAVLTNGVRGAADYKVHWLGWEGVDFVLVLDLGAATTVREIALSTLSDARSWILHPASVGCEISVDGIAFRNAGTKSVVGDHREEDPVRTFSWSDDTVQPGTLSSVRYVLFRVEGVKRLPDWHASAGGAAWVFVDEIVVR